MNITDDFGGCYQFICDESQGYRGLVESTNLQWGNRNPVPVWMSNCIGAS